MPVSLLTNCRPIQGENISFCFPFLANYIFFVLPRVLSCRLLNGQVSTPRCFVLNKSFLFQNTFWDLCLVCKCSQPWSQRLPLPLPSCRPFGQRHQLQLLALALFSGSAPWSWQSKWYAVQFYRFSRPRRFD
jgi:hypothetical protein